MTQIPNANPSTPAAAPQADASTLATAAPVGSTPVAAPAVAGPDPTPAGQPTDLTGSPSATTPMAIAPAAFSPAEFAKQYPSLNPASFEGFKDEASATAAVRLYAETIARQGMQPAPNVNAGLPGFPYHAGGAQPTAPQQQAPAAYPQFAEPQAPATYTPIDLSALGVEDDEPAAKAIRALETKLESVFKEVTATKSEVSGYTAAAKAAASAKLEAEADSIVDNFRSPMYGVGQHRSMTQQIACQNLRNVVNAITTEDWRASNGQYVRPLAERFALAKLVLDQQTVASTIQQQAPAAQPIPPAPSSSAASLPTDATLDVFGAPWSANPQVRALIGA